jgi:formate/nitrite transporter FocA (FNT family)
MYGFDAFSPAEIFAKVETVGVTKARLATGPMLMLSVLAGAFIGMGALYYVLVRSDPTLGFAARQVLGGAVFSLGLLMVVVAGAELFTGNNLLVMAWADDKISTRELLRSWLIVFCGNFIGAVGLAFLVVLFVAVRAQWRTSISRSGGQGPCPSSTRSSAACWQLLVCVAIGWRSRAQRRRKAVATCFRSPRSSPPASNTRRNA